MQIEGIEVEVIRKSIKNMHLYVLPPEGKVRVTVPLRLSEKRIAAFLALHREWVFRRREAILSQPPKIEKAYLSGDRVSLWGQDYPLEVREKHRGCKTALVDGSILLYVPKDASVEVREKALENWYREQLLERAEELMSQWKERIGVDPHELRIRKMKTRWGSCQTRDKRIWLSLNLVSYPPECVEYVVVHELCHLLRAAHDSVFYGHMSRFLPDWRERKQLLRRLYKDSGT